MVLNSWEVIGPGACLRCCSCCKAWREIATFCGFYDVCFDCAVCQSLGGCSDKQNVEICCHGEICGLGKKEPS